MFLRWSDRLNAVCWTAIFTIIHFAPYAFKTIHRKFDKCAG